MLIFIEASEYLNAMDVHRVYIRQIIQRFQYFPISSSSALPSPRLSCVSHFFFYFHFRRIRFIDMLSPLHCVFFNPDVANG